MDDRLVIALALALGLVLIGGVLVLRYSKKRRAFKLRQLGRGKAVAHVPAE